MYPIRLAGMHDDSMDDEFHNGITSHHGIQVACMLFGWTEGCGHQGY